MTYLQPTTKTLKKLLVNFHDVSLKYDELVVLKDLFFDIYEQDFIYLIGPNGAGKSSLIKLLTNLIKPTTGKIILHTNLLGYLPQTLNQKSNFPITVYETIYTGFLQQKLIISRQDYLLMDYWLAKMEIANLGNKLMSTLSGGQMQRVYLIRSLISKPDLLVLDEPTSAIDPAFRKTFYDILNDLNNEGMTIIFITHDINDTLKDRKVLYLDQKIIFYGRYDEYLLTIGGHHHA